MNESQSNSFLAEQPVGALMRKFSLPCILSLLVGALYNIVDQLFIANASYLGSYGNAANSVVFPLTVIALAIATMIGDGCCAYVSIRLGAGEQEQAHRSVGNAIVLTLIVSVVLTAVYLIFMDPILTAFGATVNAETFALSREYCFWIALGIPFYMFGQAMNPIIRSDGSPRYAMLSLLAGAVCNIILDPIFIFPCGWGMMGAAVATVIGQILSAVQRHRRDLQPAPVLPDPHGGSGHRHEVFPDRHLHCHRALGRVHPRRGVQHRRRATRPGAGAAAPAAAGRGGRGARGDGAV